VDEMKGNVDNLVTLCLDQIDGDRLASVVVSKKASPASKRKRSSIEARQLFLFD